MPSLEAVLQLVEPKIVPTERERQKMAKLADRIMRDVERILDDSNITATVSLQGSFARDTWLRNETDLDIFIRFPPSVERGEWIDRVLPAIRKGLGTRKITERYAEHPFLEFHVEGIRVNVVPCYDVEKGHWKSATDRTPYHTEFMKANLTLDLRLESRYLKKFVKGIGAYGAEIEVGGFSGMLVDTLALYYGSFFEALTQASSWTPGIRLEVGRPVSILEPKKREKGVELLVIDPVDPDRNLATAVRPDKLWTFVAASRQFLQRPGTDYFFPRKFTGKTRNQFSKRIINNPREIVAVTFKHPVLVPDVLWGQLMKLQRSLVEMLNREDFEIYRSKIWSDKNTQSAILLEADRTILPDVKLQGGPPVAKKEDSLSFLQRHLFSADTTHGPWIEGDRWIVEKRRRASTIPATVKDSLQEASYGFTLPQQIGLQFSQTVKVLQGPNILPLLGKKSFDEVLWNFLEAKPSWLKRAK